MGASPSPLPLFQSQFLQRFTCLGATCPDTCCKGWDMQVTPETTALYAKEAPELLPTVTESKSGPIMRREGAEDSCIKFDAGWCAIHRDYGDRFLCDACHFYPRVTRRLGDTAYMTAALSCPEAARLALFDADALTWLPARAERLPHQVKDYLPASLSQDSALAVHQAFVQAALDPALSAEQALLRLASVARSLDRLAPERWQDAMPFYLKMAAGRLPAAEYAVADPFNLVHLLNTLMSNFKSIPWPRLEATLTAMAHALSVVLERQPPNIVIAGGSGAASDTLHDRYWFEWQPLLAPILKRWLATQLTMSLFPYAGLGHSAEERATILGVRFATVRLALMSLFHTYHQMPPEAEIVRVVQSLSKFLDHLPSGDELLVLYREIGWTREARLRGLLEKSF